MAIFRFKASQDNTITDGYGSLRTTRATDANMGASDILEVYSLYGSFSTASLENSRVLIQFDTASIAASRSAGSIPASGSTKFYLRMFNAPHASTSPSDFKLTVNAVSRSAWDEGIGLDMESYLDLGVSNWLTAAFDGTTYTTWLTSGSDYYSSSLFTNFEQSFTTGIEDLEVDVTDLVEQWLDATKPNYGFLVKLSSSYESGASNTIPSASYYTKKFFARGTEYYFKQPLLEARWDDSKNDDRGNFYASSSLAATAENANNIYFYNYIRGQLRDIPTIGTGTIYVNYYPATGAGSGAINSSAITGGWSSTGIYTASGELNTTASTVYDVWFSSSVEYHTGSAITVNNFASSAFNYNPNPQHVINITNLRDSYRNEKARFRVFVRDKDWSPTIYTVASTAITTKIVEKAYYQVRRTVDDLIVVPYGTGSGDDAFTLMSYDKNGEYFDFEMNNLESGYQYELSFVFYENGKYAEQTDKFLFRVDY